MVLCSVIGLLRAFSLSHFFAAHEYLQSYQSCEFEFEELYFFVYRLRFLLGPILWRPPHLKNWLPMMPTGFTSELVSSCPLRHVDIVADQFEKIGISRLIFALLFVLYWLGFHLVFYFSYGPDSPKDRFTGLTTTFISQHGYIWCKYSLVNCALTSSLYLLVLSASMARKIYLRGGIGVGAFKKIYGGRKSNGVRPSHFAKSSGSIARHCLKQLEALNIVEKDPKG